MGPRADAHQVARRGGVQRGSGAVDEGLQRAHGEDAAVVVGGRRAVVAGDADVRVDVGVAAVARVGVEGVVREERVPPGGVPDAVAVGHRAPHVGAAAAAPLVQRVVDVEEALRLADHLPQCEARVVAQRGGERRERALDQRREPLALEQPARRRGRGAAAEEREDQVEVVVLGQLEEGGRHREHAGLDAAHERRAAQRERIDDGVELEQSLGLLEERQPQRVAAVLRHPAHRVLDAAVRRPAEAEGVGGVEVVAEAAPRVADAVDEVRRRRGAEVQVGRAGAEERRARHLRWPPRECGGCRVHALAWRCLEMCWGREQN